MRFSNRAVTCRWRPTIPCAAFSTGQPRYREALIETAIVTNAALTAYTVQQELQAAKNNALRAVYGVYLLRGHEVWAPHRGIAQKGLSEPPKDLPAFIDLADLIVHSNRIASLLTTA
jgi:carbonic anhydrase